MFHPSSPSLKFGIDSIAPAHLSESQSESQSENLNKNRSEDVGEGLSAELEPLDAASQAEQLIFMDATATHSSEEGVTTLRGRSFVLRHLSERIEDDRQIKTTTRDMYLKLLALREQSDAPCLIRFWNYVPFINRGDGDHEVYKQFCTGRLDAFKERKLTQASFPAASALGHLGRHLTVQMLTSTQQGTHHGNPQQVDAFKYPREYGVSSPSFARSTSVTIDDSSLVFVSGTAAITGHRSQFSGDFPRQLDLTIENIASVLTQTNRSISDVVAARVYLANAHDYLEAFTKMNEAMPGAAKVYLRADVCRSELLVEVECICR